MVVRMGPRAREWHITDTETDAVVFSQRLEPGTAVFMTMAGNEKYKHGVPEMQSDGQEEKSGSIVLRNITTSFTRAEVEKKQKHSLNSKQKAKSKKAGSSSGGGRGGGGGGGGGGTGGTGSGAGGGSRGRQAKTNAMAGIREHANWDNQMTELQQQVEECAVCQEEKGGEYGSYSRYSIRV
jgi:hypothetical protein